MLETVSVPPVAPEATVRSFVNYWTRDDGSREVVEMRHEVAVDGEWIDVRDLIEAWRSR